MLIYKKSRGFCLLQVKSKKKKKKNKWKRLTQVNHIDYFSYIWNTFDFQQDY